MALQLVRLSLTGAVTALAQASTGLQAAANPSTPALHATADTNTLAG